MLGRNPSEPTLVQKVDVESPVPASHQLRKIDVVLDWSFVPDMVAECYSATRGRPRVDPGLPLRMMLLGVLYDLSDRELCDEFQRQAGMRRLRGLSSHDLVPDNSTLSRLRNQRWSVRGFFDRLMDEVIRQCSEVGLVSGRHLSVDGTEVRADASMKSLGTARPPQARRSGPAVRFDLGGRERVVDPANLVAAVQPNATGCLPGSERLGNRRCQYRDP